MSNSYPSVPPTETVPLTGSATPAGVVPPIETVTPGASSTDFPTTSTGKHSETGNNTGGDSGTGSSGTADHAKETADRAKEEASKVADGAKESAQKVAGTAKDEAAKVAGEAKAQASDLIKQTSSELKDQAGVQQKRVASGLHSLSDELTSMADKSEGGGVAADLVQQVAGRAGSVATWLDDRDPGSLLGEVKDFARRRPGAFIGIAAVAGVLAGRLTRSLTSVAKDEASTTDGPSTPATDEFSSTTPASPSAPSTTAVSTPVEPALYPGEPAYADDAAYPGSASGTDPLTGGRIVP